MSAVEDGVQANGGHGTLDQGTETFLRSLDGWIQFAIPYHTKNELVRVFVEVANLEELLQELERKRLVPQFHKLTIAPLVRLGRAKVDDDRTTVVFPDDRP